MLSALGAGFSIAGGIFSSSAVTAQIPVSTMTERHFGGTKLRPVAKLNTRPAPSTSVSSQQREGWNLRWRRSDQVGRQAPMSGQANVFGDPPGMNIRQASSRTPTQIEIQNSVRQVTHAAVVMPQEEEPLRMPSGSASDATPQQDIDFFEDPFGVPEPKTKLPLPSDDVNPRLSAPTADAAAPTLPSESREMNDLQNGLRGDDADSSAMKFFDTPPSQTQPAPEAAIPPPTLDPVPEPQPPTTMPREDGPSLPDLMRQSAPNQRQTPPRKTIDLLPPPADPSDSEPSSSDAELFDDPFRRDSVSDADRRDRERLRQQTENGSGRTALDDELERLSDDEDGAPVTGISCEDFRNRIARQTIREVSLDISPPFRPDVIDEQEYQDLKAQFDENQDLRQWRTIDGRPLASGRLVDLAYEKAVIDTGDGREQELSINQLSEADLAYISENWGLPSECLIEQVAYTPRTWTASTVTWKASNLCHHPLYFEEVNLERYGHTAGPVLQPIVSSAHFFANIAVLPYKKGIHPPSECQYALGYYRPGNCAPWIVPPVPLSVRGAARQAAEMTAAFWLIP